MSGRTIRRCRDGRKFKRKSLKSDHGPPKLGKHNFLRRRAVSRFPVNRCTSSFICVNLSRSVAYTAFLWSFWQVPAHHLPRAMRRGFEKPAAFKALATSCAWFRRTPEKISQPPGFAACAMRGAAAMRTSLKRLARTTSNGRRLVSFNTSPRETLIVRNPLVEAFCFAIRTDTGS